MKIGIVGLPNVGKSTLFKALTHLQVDINNYPFCTIEPNVGRVAIPDERVDTLAKMFSSQKKIYATVEFVDIAGLVAGASKGEGLGNKFLAHIREVDAIVQVVRTFSSPKIIHTQPKINPLEDIAIINTELLLADIETINKKLLNLEKEIKKQDSIALATKNLAERLKEIIDTGHLGQTQKFLANLKKEEWLLLKDFHLLCFKPILYLFNTAKSEDLPSRELLQKEAIHNWLALDIKNEEDLSELSQEEQAQLGVSSQLDKLIKKAYKMLSLINFFTAGKTETRAWTIPKNSLAPRAGRAIHSDFEKKFICAEVVAYSDLVIGGSKTQAKEKGLLRIVGKDYIVQDGDVIEFKI